MRGRQGTVLKTQPGTKGYLKFRVGGDGKFVPVHTAVLLAFVGPRPVGHEGSHLNGDNIDNRWENLVWMTAVENNAMQIEHGTRLVGTQCSWSRLTEDDVRAIRASPHGNRHLGQQYGVDRSAIYQIRERRTWAHVT